MLQVTVGIMTRRMCGVRARGYVYMLAMALMLLLQGIPSFSASGAQKNQLMGRVAMACGRNGCWPAPTSKVLRVVQLGHQERA